MNNSGTLIYSPIRPASTSDNFPVAFANEIKGGLHTVNSLVDRDNIAVDRRQEGMRCYVIETKSSYVLNGDLTSWAPDGEGSSFEYITDNDGVVNI